MPLRIFLLIIQNYVRKVTVLENYIDIEFIVDLVVEAVGVEPTSENISTRLSPSAGHIFCFASTDVYVQASVSAISDYTT